MVGSTDRVEVRLLGPLQVVRTDGRPVQQHEWRTTRSADLLRLLALQPGAPVAVHTILSRFWPDVEEKAGRASLRTALTHVRAVVGRDAVQRVPGGIALMGAWVDVPAYRLLAADARTAGRAGRHADLVRIARESESLYTADFEAFDDSAPWVRDTRETLIDMRKRLLSDAAESAVEVRWLQDAVDFAESAIALDPGLERAYRALMRAYAGLGETEKALRAFDRCRRYLASTQGAHPSPLTSAVHVQILAGPRDDVRQQRLVGRDHEVNALVAQLEAAQHDEAPVLLWVTGEPGTGRDTVIDRALRAVDSTIRSSATVCRTEEERLSTTNHVRVAMNAAGEGGSRPTMVLLCKGPTTGLARLREPVRSEGFSVREVAVGPLPPEQLAELAETVLAGPVSPALLARLGEASEGRAGDAVRLLRGWTSRGAVVWTAAGLELVAVGSGWQEEHSFGRVLRELQRELTPTAVLLMQALALLDRPVSAGELVPFLRMLSEDVAGARARSTPPALEPLLDLLTDLGVLRTGHRGFEWRNPQLRDATTSSTGPAVRRRLLARLTEAGLREDPSSAPGTGSSRTATLRLG